MVYNHAESRRLWTSDTVGLTGVYGLALNQPHTRKSHHELIFNIAYRIRDVRHVRVTYEVI